MWWNKKKTEEQQQEHQYEMILTKHYTLTVYEHVPGNIQNRYNMPELMRIILTEIWDEEGNVMIDYQKDYIRINHSWYKVIQRYKMSEYDYVLVVENMAYYRELDEKIDEENNDER